jgi:Nucleotidyl transferase AbiEii toxin, Type IV TA system
VGTQGSCGVAGSAGLARHSKDVDLFRQSSVDLDEVEQAFRGAAGRDVGDFFLFEVGQAAPLVGDKGRRYPIVAMLGGRPFAAFSVDVVAGQVMTAPPEVVPPLLTVEIPGLLRVDYQAYPLVDHIADKVSACLETHAHVSGAASVSSRYKDLVDLVLIARTQELVAVELRRALLSVAGLRGIGLPAEFNVPGPLWPAGYEAKAREVPQLGDLGRFAAAMALVKTMIDPVLAGTAVGRWEPALVAWVA